MLRGIPGSWLVGREEIFLENMVTFLDPLTLKVHSDRTSGMIRGTAIHKSRLRPPNPQVPVLCPLYPFKKIPVGIMSGILTII